MSALNSLLSAGSNATSSTPPSAAANNAFASLSSSDFIKIMMSELQNQDPFQPQDSSKMLEQLSSLRNVESQLSLQTQLQSLVSQNQLAQAGGMIGKLVGGLDDVGNQVQGVVMSVRVQNNRAMLELDSGKLLGMDKLATIGTKPAATTTTTGTGTGTGA